MKGRLSWPTAIDGCVLVWQTMRIRKCKFHASNARLSLLRNWSRNKCFAERGNCGFELDSIRSLQIARQIKVPLPIKKVRPLSLDGPPSDNCSLWPSWGHKVCKACLELKSEIQLDWGEWRDKWLSGLARWRHKAALLGLLAAKWTWTRYSCRKWARRGRWQDDLCARFGLFWRRKINCEPLRDIARHCESRESIRRGG